MSRSTRRCLIVATRSPLWPTPSEPVSTPQRFARLADEWLATAAVPLEGVSNSWEYIGKPGARVALSHDTVYLDPGDDPDRATGFGPSPTRPRPRQRHRQPPDSRAIDPPTRRRCRHELGPDQAAAIRSITQSGHQFQAVEGLAGAGKTTAMSAAVDAWQAAGYQVVAAAPFGAAARKLENEIGIPTRTVAGLLEYMKHNGPEQMLDARTVVLVDEASTLSTRQTGDLYHAVHQDRGHLRTVGDPLQHSSVEAGGLWQAVVQPTLRRPR